MALVNGRVAKLRKGNLLALPSARLHTGRMTQDGSVVAQTNDALCVLRSGPEATRFGVLDPYAGWFVTPAGERMYQLASTVDKTFVPYNLARYVVTTRALAAAAHARKQIVVLGAGTDCRALTLPELEDVPVFLVDRAQVGAFRQEVLQRHGITGPSHIKEVSLDLAREELPEGLAQAGWDRDAPTLLLAEGVMFYLPNDRSLRILDPRWLPAGSDLWCDLWSPQRVALLNGATAQALSEPMFHALDLAALRSLGWAQLNVTPFERICAELGHDAPDLAHEGWVAVSASR